MNYNDRVDGEYKFKMALEATGMTDNLTRGQQYGVTPRPEKVVWDDERNDWVAVTDEEWRGDWGCWDPDFGWQAPWPVDLRG